MIDKTLKRYELRVGEMKMLIMAWNFYIKKIDGQNEAEFLGQDKNGNDVVIGKVRSDSDIIIFAADNIVT